MINVKNLNSICAEMWYYSAKTIKIWNFANKFAAKVQISYTIFAKF